MPNKTPYELADRTITLLNKKAIQRFQKAKGECAALKFDELNVIQVMKRLYQDLKADNQKAFLDLAHLVYIDIYNSPAQEPDLSWLLALLDEYDPVTKYVYEHEVDRKREYATEAIIAAPAKAEQFRKALSYWAKFTAYYADEVEWRSTIKAFKDSGAKKVVWHTAEDERVCEQCSPMDGEVYPIDDIPPRPHWGCRCWVTEYKQEKTEKPEKEKGSKDVTQEYLNKATPGKGEVTLEDGYRTKGNKDEIDTAYWLKEKFGGFIKALKESEKDGVERPDYEWNGKLWERKRSKSISGADKRLQKALSQIGENPGGVILYFNSSDFDIELLEAQLMRRFMRDETTVTDFDLILFINGEFIKVLRYKK